MVVILSLIHIFTRIIPFLVENACQRSTLLLVRPIFSNTAIRSCSSAYFLTMWKNGLGRAANTSSAFPATKITGRAGSLSQTASAVRSVSSALSPERISQESASGAQTSPGPPSGPRGRL